MAHFLEHLVFKGGEKYDDYRKVNETAETMGAMLNAYTSHDLVAFHITCAGGGRSARRSTCSPTSSAARSSTPRSSTASAASSSRRSRAPTTSPPVLAEHLIDRAAFGDHPLGRPVLGPEEHLRTFSRDAILAFRRRQWSGARGGAFLVGNLESLPEDGELAELLRPLPVDLARRQRASRRPPFEPAHARRGARLQPVAPAPLLPPRRSTRARRASAPR